MTAEICPSILSCNPANFESPVRQMMEARADWIHLDVMDGQFVPPITFGGELADALSGLGDTPLEAHLMTETPERHFDAFKACRRITFHLEAAPHAHRLCQQLQARGQLAGVAINPGTSEKLLEPLVGIVNLFLVMTVNPGWGGQALIPECIEKVRRLRAMAPETPIQVDGGVDATSIRALWEAGATSFVAGSYLMKASTIADGIGRLREQC